MLRSRNEAEYPSIFFVIKPVMRPFRVHDQGRAGQLWNSQAAGVLLLSIRYELPLIRNVLYWR